MKTLTHSRFGGRRSGSLTRRGTSQPSDHSAPELLARSPEPIWAPLVIRLATRRDQRALELLAQLDSAPPPRGEMVIGEIQGHAVAAASPSDGTTIADPFRGREEITALVALRAQQLGLRAREEASRARMTEVRPAAGAVRGAASRSAPSSRCAGRPLSSS